MNKSEKGIQTLVVFFNTRVERHILNTGSDIEDYYVRKELREHVRSSVINKPFDILFSILRSEFEEEQGILNSTVFPEDVVARAFVYADMRKDKLHRRDYSFVPGWSRYESGTDAEVPVILAYYGARLLTGTTPKWATAKFRRTARCRHLTIK